MNQDFIVHKKAISKKQAENSPPPITFLMVRPYLVSSIRLFSISDLLTVYTCISCGTYCNEDKCCVVTYPAADFCVAWLVNLISGVIIIFFASLFLWLEIKG